MSDEAYRTRVGDSLRAALFLNGIEAGDLAKTLGVTTETVRRWLRGNVEPRPSTMASICDALDVPEALLVRPPATRAATLAMIAAHRESRRAPAGDPQPD